MIGRVMSAPLSKDLTALNTLIDKYEEKMKSIKDCPPLDSPEFATFAAAHAPSVEDYEVYCASVDKRDYILRTLQYTDYGKKMNPPEVNGSYMTISDYLEKFGVLPVVEPPKDDFDEVKGDTVFPQYSDHFDRFDFVDYLRARVNSIARAHYQKEYDKHMRHIEEEKQKAENAKAKLDGVNSAKAGSAGAAVSTTAKDA